MTVYFTRLDQIDLQARTQHEKNVEKIEGRVEQKRSSKDIEITRWKFFMDSILYRTREIREVTLGVGESKEVGVVNVVWEWVVAVMCAFVLRLLDGV